MLSVRHFMFIVYQIAVIRFNCYDVIIEWSLKSLLVYKQWLSSQNRILSFEQFDAALLSSYDLPSLL